MVSNDNDSMGAGYSLGHVIAVVDDLIAECEDAGEDLKAVAVPLTLFELKLLRDAVVYYG